jgi:hypothetical protein
MIFRAPRFEADGEMLEHARFTVLQNGIVIQDNVQVTGTATPTYDVTINSGPYVSGVAITVSPNDINGQGNGSIEERHEALGLGLHLLRLLPYGGYQLPRVFLCDS